VYRKSLLWIVVVSLLGLINSASAAVWEGNGTDDSWCTSQNWDAGITPYWEDVTINPVTPRDPVIDCNVDVDFVMGPRYSGDLDQSMDIVSGNIYFWRWRMEDGGSGASIVNITGGNVEVWSDSSWDCKQGALCVKS
jgi:hypothetical protein